MNNDETISEYLERVNNVVLSIRGLDEKMDISFVIKKVLRTLTFKYESKVSAIEEAKDLNTLTWDEPDQGPDLLKRLVESAHQHGTKIKLSIGGWTGSK